MKAAACTGGPERGQRRIRGAVLAEFALLGFVVWLLLAGVLEIGRALTAQQLIQHAARTMAREMARLPLAADLAFSDAVRTNAFRTSVLDPGFLVIDSELLALRRQVGLRSALFAAHKARWGASPSTHSRR